jgi:hypothetical protein
MTRISRQHILTTVKQFDIIYRVHFEQRSPSSNRLGCELLRGGDWLHLTWVNEANEGYGDGD